MKKLLTLLCLAAFGGAPLVKAADSSTPLEDYQPVFNQHTPAAYLEALDICKNNYERLKKTSLRLDYNRVFYHYWVWLFFYDKAPLQERLDKLVAALSSHPQDEEQPESPALLCVNSPGAVVIDVGTTTLKLYLSVLILGLKVEGVDDIAEEMTSYSRSELLERVHKNRELLKTMADVMASQAHSRSLQIALEKYKNHLASMSISEEMAQRYTEPGEALETKVFKDICTSLLVPQAQQKFAGKVLFQFLQKPTMDLPAFVRRSALRNGFEALKNKMASDKAEEAYLELMQEGPHQKNAKKKRVRNRKKKRKNILISGFGRPAPIKIPGSSFSIEPAPEKHLSNANVRPQEKPIEAQTVAVTVSKPRWTSDTMETLLDREESPSISVLFDMVNYCEKEGVDVSKQVQRKLYAALAVEFFKGEKVGQDFEEAALYFCEAASNGCSISARNVCRMARKKLTAPMGGDYSQEVYYFYIWALRLAQHFNEASDYIISLKTELIDFIINEGFESHSVAKKLELIQPLLQDPDSVASPKFIPKITSDKLANEYDKNPFAAIAEGYESAQHMYGNSRPDILRGYEICLGNRYFKGDGISTNLYQVLSFWTRAANRGSIEAAVNVGCIIRNMDELNPIARFFSAGAFEWWRHALLLSSHFEKNNSFNNALRFCLSCYTQGIESYAKRFELLRTIYW